LKQIELTLHNNITAPESAIAFLIDEENSIVFYHYSVWLARVSKSKDKGYFTTPENPMSLLGEQKPINESASLEDYAKHLFKKLKNTSLLDYIVQKHFYDDQEFNFDIT
jgi:hypothetical protein